jgi:hypothetical protein
MGKLDSHVYVDSSDVRNLDKHDRVSLALSQLHIVGTSLRYSLQHRLGRR